MFMLLFMLVLLGITMLSGSSVFGVIGWLALPDLTWIFSPPTSYLKLRRYRYRRNKRLRPPESVKNLKSDRTPSFRRRALPYHLVMRCRRRGGDRPRHRHWNSSYKQFRCHLSHTLLLKRLKMKSHRLYCKLYIEQVFKDVEMREKFGYSPTLLDPIEDLGGVPEDIYTPFFNLHNPLTVHTPMESNDVLTIEDYLDANPPDESTLTIDYASYSRVPDNFFEYVESLNTYFFQAAEMSTASPKKESYSTMPLIFDTGASIGLTPFRSDFIDYMELDNVSVKDIARNNKVLGVGTVMWKFTNREGKEVFLPLVCYHVEHAAIRLLSPQQYFKSHGGRAELSGNSVNWHLPNKAIIDIPIDERSNLPMIWNVSTTSSEQKDIGPHLIGMATTFGDFEVEALSNSNGGEFRSQASIFDTISNKQASAFSTCFPCVADETNQQLTGPQKELLLWHWKLGINMQHVQELMHDRVFQDGDDEPIRLPPILPTKHVTTKSCSIPMCMSCELAKMRTRTPKVKVSKAIAEKEGVLSRDCYEPGDMVSSDQFNVHTAGRKLNGYGRESAENGYHGGTVYIDASSGLVRVEMQVSMTADETIIGKHKFEQWVYDLASVCVKKYHSDNGVYDSAAFREDCAGQNQKQSFSGVGAKHQNAVAERCIQTMSYWARTMMVHAAIHWPSNGADNLRLWPFAMKQAEWLYNRLPNRKSGLTPLELFTKEKADHRDLLRAHVWGCPVYVLDPTLQDGKKIPKWNKRSRLGQFLGFSDEHSSLVGRVRHLNTNFVSPQYHVVYDDKFETIHNGTTISDTGAESIFTDLFENSRDHYAPTERDEHGDIVFEPPPLQDLWLSESERREKRVELERRRVREKQRWMTRNRELEELRTSPPSSSPSPSNDPNLPLVSDDDYSSDSSDDDDDDSIPPPDSPPSQPSASLRQAPEGVPIPPVPLRRSRRVMEQQVAPPESQVRRSRRDMKGTKRLVADPRFGNMLSIEDPNATFTVLNGSRQTPILASQARVQRSDRRYQSQYDRRTAEYEEYTLNTMDWGNQSTISEFMQSEIAPYFQLSFDKESYGLSDYHTMEDMMVNYANPFVLAAKTAASSADNPTWDQAMKGPFAEEYWRAAEVEVETLEKIRAWNVIERTAEMNVLPGTWAFKCKRYPDGKVKKFKARFCARGDRQKEGIDFTETYAPVAQWTTVRMMLILECLLGLKSKQGDISCAFLHAELEPHERIYVEMPRGFKQYDKNGRPKVLSLLRFLYGLRNSPRAFWMYLTKKLEACGMRQSKLDPCLFVGAHVIVVCYVDDVLFWSKDEKYIYELGTKLREAEVDLEEESDAAGFLGVDLVRLPGGRIHMKQPGLIKRVITALGFDESETTSKKTPAERKPLTKDEDGEPAQESFSYASVVGMLLYLSGHSRPDLCYSVSQVARFMFAPKRSHEVALKRIGRYLVGTADKGIILDPKNATSLHIDAYPDADFAGLYGYEESTDPVCVRSRTGYIIAVANCPVVIYSSLQTETALSTMQAEIYAMAQCCKALFPLVKMVKELSGAAGLPLGGPPQMKITLHEDNTGALILAKTIPPEFTPRSKFYALKTIWFREQIVVLGIEVVKIDTKLQWGDICTKMPPVVTFEFLRDLIMGW